MYTILSKQVKILIGVPGSGKSTYANQFKDIKEIKIISSDKIREELTDGRPTYSREENFQVFEKVKLEYLNNLIDSRIRIIFIDATNINFHFRKIYKELAKTYKYENIEIECIYFNTSLAICKERIDIRAKNGGLYVPQNILEKYYNAQHQQKNFPKIGIDCDKYSVLSNYMLY